MNGWSAAKHPRAVPGQAADDCPKRQLADKESRQIARKATTCRTRSAGVAQSNGSAQPTARAGPHPRSRRSPERTNFQGPKTHPPAANRPTTSHTATRTTDHPPTGRQTLPPASYWALLRPPRRRPARGGRGHVTVVAGGQGNARVSSAHDLLTDQYRRRATARQGPQVRVNEKFLIAVRSPACSHTPA